MVPLQKENDLFQRAHLSLEIVKTKSKWLQKLYPTSAPLRTKLYGWLSKFKMDRKHILKFFFSRTRGLKEITNAKMVRKVHRNE